MQTTLKSEASVNTGALEEKKAGDKITKSVPVIEVGKTLKDVTTILKAQRFTTIDYIYVVDGNRKLIGVFPISALFIHTGETKVADICRKSSLVKVPPKAERKKAAHLAIEHNIKAVPVVDNGIFLGVISNDDILSTLKKEFHQTLTRLAGVHQDNGNVDNILRISLMQAFLHRIPWLLVGLGGGLFAALVMSFFEKTLEQNIILALYIPLMVYMAGAVSSQMNIFLIRDLALFHGEFNHRRYFLRQFVVSSFIGISTAIVLIIMTFILHSNLKVSTVLGISLVTTISSASISGLIVPYILYFLKQDPANASGPVSTIIQDIISIVIFFAVARLLL